MSLSLEQLTEEQEQFLKGLEEEFKDRYTEKEEGFKATMEETKTSPPVVENWRDFGRFDDRRRDDGYRDRSRSRNRGGHWNRGENERSRYGDRYSQSSTHGYYSRQGYRGQNHYQNDNRWH